MLNTRRRLVTFRISDEEHASLRKVYVASGSRSISDFARAAALERARAQSTARRFIADDLATVAAQLQGLDLELRQLSSRIARLLGTYVDGE